MSSLLAVPHLLPYSCAKSAVGASAKRELRGDGVSVTAVHPRPDASRLAPLAAEFGSDQAKEFTWFSALAGAPLVSMDARRAADHIVTAVERRRTKIVLSPNGKGGQC